MSEDYFKCDLEICGNARCCREDNTKPILSFGDYMRIGEYTGRKASEVWKEDGEVSLVMRQDQWGPNHFLIQMSLKHNPCVYLNDDNQCRIYEVRPFVCADFPISMYLVNQDVSMVMTQARQR